MEGLLAIVLGAVAVAVAPLVPAVRPVAKGAVKGGMALGTAAAGVAAMAVAQADHLREGISSSFKHASEPIVVDSVAAEPARADSTADSIGATAPTPEPVVAAVAPEVIATGDDLMRVVGIGPKAAAALETAGITTYAALAATSVQELREILLRANPRFRVVDPSTWPTQAAQFAAEIDQ